MLGQKEIQKYLPHRFPFLLVDRILELEKDKRIVGIKNVTINEPFFTGHFPEIPVMPGVLIIEAMAQVAGILAMESMGREEMVNVIQLGHYSAIAAILLSIGPSILWLF